MADDARRDRGASLRGRRRCSWLFGMIVLASCSADSATTDTSIPLSATWDTSGVFPTVYCALFEEAESLFGELSRFGSCQEASLDDALVQNIGFAEEFDVVAIPDGFRVTSPDAEVQQIGHLVQIRSRDGHATLDFLQGAKLVARATFDLSDVAGSLSWIEYP